MTVNFGMVSPYMNSYMMGGMNGDMMMNGMMNGMMMNPQMQISYMNQWDKYGVDRQVDMYKNQNNAQFQMSAQTDSISRQIRILESKIKSNSQNQVMPEYNKLIQAVKNAYGTQLAKGADKDTAEQQVKAFAERLYAQQTGTYITDDIKQNGSGSFWQGVKQILSFGLGNRSTAEENIAKINGTALSKEESAKKIAGNVVGSLMGGLLAVGAFFLGKKA